jgi:hypothetical protein
VTVAFTSEVVLGKLDVPPGLQVTVGIDEAPGLRV